MINTSNCESFLVIYLRLSFGKLSYSDVITVMSEKKEILITRFLIYVGNRVLWLVNFFSGITVMTRERKSLPIDYLWYRANPAELLQKKSTKSNWNYKELFTYSVFDQFCINSCLENNAKTFLLANETRMRWINFYSPTNFLYIICISFKVTNRYCNDVYYQ